MAGTPNRLSTYSNTSSPAFGGIRFSAPQSTQVSTTTLLNTLHTIYTSSKPYHLDASTSLVVNTWLTAANITADGRQGGTVDGELAKTAWEHARRRAEDGCIVLGSLHQSTPSLLVPFISTLPISIPSSFYTALSALKPFTHSVSPSNPSAPRHIAFAATFTLQLDGNLTSASLSLSKSGLDTSIGLLNIPPEPGYRAFDVFHYLLTSASTPAEREYLGLKAPSAYGLLNKSGTYDPPPYLAAADDAAAAEDFRACLKAIGIKGSTLRSLLSVLAGLLKLGNTTGFLVDEEVLEEICEDVGGLLGLDPEVLVQKCNTQDREVLIGGLYEALVDWIILKANAAIATEMQIAKEGDSSSESDAGGARTPRTDEDQGDTVIITVLEIPGETLGKAVALRGVFDDTTGINAEMKVDGVEVTSVGSSVLREMKNAIAEIEADLGMTGGPTSRAREHERDRKEGVLEKIGAEAEDGSFLKKILYPVAGEGISVGRTGRFDLATKLGSSRVWYQLALHPTDESPASLASLASTTSAWSAGTVSRQLRAWRLPEWANRRNKNLDFTADFDIDEFCTRYSRLGCKEGKDGVESWIMERGWSNGELVVGHERVWVREGAWWEAENMLDMKTAEEMSHGNHGSRLGSMMGGIAPLESGYSTTTPGLESSGFFGPPVQQDLSPHGSKDNLLGRQQSSATLAHSAVGGRRSVAPTLAPTFGKSARNTSGGDYGLGIKGDETKGGITYHDPDIGQFTSEMDPEIAEPKHVTSQPITKARRAWVALTWALTFWIPSFLLRYVGRMKRPDVRMAWREKIVLMLLIFLLNASIIFYIIELGRLICPNNDKAWDQKEVSTHQGDDDFWVSVHGKVYDISKFWRQQHSRGTFPETSSSNMQPFAGMNLDQYFVIPLTVGCPGLVTDDLVKLESNSTLTTDYHPEAMHVSGPVLQPDNSTSLHEDTWYTRKFLKRMKDFEKGDLVTDTNKIKREGQNDNHLWFILHGGVYDLTDYFYTKKLKTAASPQYGFFPSDVEQLVQRNAGTDITGQWERTLNRTTNLNSLNCLKNIAYVGKTDFRKTPRCQVNNWLLLAFSIILCTVILTKFLAALQLGSKKRPPPQDKFVICQVPAYTEGEDQLRKGLDSLTSLQYDNKRKLICVICDGMIVGGGNDRPTPKIVLDILGVDPKIDPPALPFKSVGQSNEQLNYGKVYSGLYEYEGNVVPYIVVVKVGKESEQTKAKPGNRGKRDSQMLLFSFLNRVHHRSPMSPLELEMFHQINNIIGVDPELYEYLLMVDADTSVKEDSLTHLVAACANNSQIAGICGETSLENEERSWWTMIQVYEYFISHNLAKAFESLFGSVTCLPGCFCMYRLRTVDKGRPLIISDKVLNEYSVGEVDTLHKKNLLALGEDRYLTTIMTKHFPSLSFKFVGAAYASTAAPETWSVLLSQRRRWINSTIHNLGELVLLKDMCGFCCFSMRFVVFIDLFGTLILPATCGYLGYLIYRVATRSGQFPLISIVMIAAVYGLQALIFIIKRQWQHIGWMIIYILAFPIYSFILPIYSFWNQDNFSWGNTRIVIGEKGNKQIVALEDEGFDPRTVPLQRWDDYATSNNLPGRRGLNTGIEKEYSSYDDNAYEMDDIHSMYSSVKPASTILTGFHGAPYMPPQSPAPFAHQRTYSNFTHYTDQPQAPAHQRMMSIGAMSDHYQDNPYAQHRTSMPYMPSTDNLIAAQQAPLMRPNSRSPQNVGYANAVDFSKQNGGPTDAEIVEAVQSCLNEVDLDTVTKKMVRAKVEGKLNTELGGERRIFLDRTIDNELANM